MRLFCFKQRRASCPSLPAVAAAAPAACESVPAPLMPPQQMATAEAAPAASQLHPASRRPPPPVRLSPDARKTMLAEMAALEDVQLYDDGKPPKPRAPGASVALAGERAVVVMVPCSRGMAAVGEPQQDVRQVAAKYGLQRDSLACAGGARFVVVPRLDFSIFDDARCREERRRAAAVKATQAASSSAAPAEASADTPSPPKAPTAVKVACAQSAAFTLAGPLAMVPPAHAVMRRNSAIAAMA